MLRLLSPQRIGTLVIVEFAVCCVMPAFGRHFGVYFRIFVFFVSNLLIC